MKNPIPQTIIDDLQAEREYQLQACGWDYGFDARNTRSDWITYIMVYLGKFATWRKAPPEETSLSARRKQLLKVATLAIAAVESLDRNNGFPERHDGVS